jgi:uncharacterized alpha-E superfamily protein
MAAPYAAMAMDLNIRRQLEELAERLRHHSPASPRTEELKGEVSNALEQDRHDGLVDRLEETAVEFEAEHPDLASALLRVADALSAAGI